jgi:hypothetical protein
MAFIVAVGYLEQMLVAAQRSMYLAGKKDQDSTDSKFFQLYYDSGGTVNMFPLQGQACAAVDHRDCQREVHRGVRQGLECCSVLNPISLHTFPNTRHL